MFRILVTDLFHKTFGHHIYDCQLDIPLSLPSHISLSLMFDKNQNTVDYYELYTMLWLLHSADEQHKIS